MPPTVFTDIYQRFYTSYIPTNESDKKKWMDYYQPIFLEQEATPKIYNYRRKQDLDEALYEHKSSYFVPIGVSHVTYVGSPRTMKILLSSKRLTKFAQKIKASLVLVHSFRRHQEFVIFLVEGKFQKKVGVGFQYSDLTEQERTTFGTNKGVIVDLVYKGTPAFYANLVRGDVVTHVDDQEVLDTESAQMFLLMHSDQKQPLSLTILRNGQQMQLSVSY